MRSDELKALGNVWAAEIDGRLPFQSKAAIYKRLADEDLIAPMEVRMGVVTVRGWELTHAGRLLYCSHCSESESEVSK